MGAVQLEHIEAAFNRPLGGADKIVAHLIHLFAGHLVGHLVGFGPRGRRGADNFPVAVVQGLVDALPHQLGGAFGAGVGQLEGKLGFGVLVYEIDNPFPGRHMRLVIEPGAAGGDPRRGGNIGHLGIDQPGPAHRPGSVMDQVEIVHQPVLGRIHAHRRDDDAVLQGHAADRKRREHRRHPVVDRPPDDFLGEPFLDPFEPVFVAQPQVFVADPLRAGEQRVSELQRLEIEVALEMLEPFGRIAGRALQLQDLEVPLLAVLFERLAEGQALVV